MLDAIMLKVCNQSTFNNVVLYMASQSLAQSTKPSDRLILVYNADSGVINALMHAVHKQFFPATYPCSLCAITYGAVSMHGDWRMFLDSLSLEIVIHHKDDFEDAYPGHRFALPAVLITDTNSAPTLLVPAEELDAIKDTNELMERVKKRLIEEQMRRPNMRIFA